MTENAVQGVWQELADGVFVRRHTSLDLNVGLVVSGDEALVIDTRAHGDHGDELRRAIAEVTAAPVRWIVNTHVHWDHTFGNQSFDGATIVGHDQTRRRLLDEAAERRAELASADWFPDDEREAMRSVVITPPVVTTATEATIHCGDRAVHLVFHGRAHTDSDVAVHVDDEVTFAGDLIEESAPPAFGPDSYPDEWPATLASLEPTLRPIVVPGHGAVVDIPFVTGQRSDIESALSRLDAGSSDGPFPAAVMEQIRLHRLAPDDR